jgi:hypothetical protein
VKWLPLLILIVVALGGLRLFMTMRRRSLERPENFDAKVVRQLRDRGLDPFSAHELDFFFVLPNRAAAQRVAQQLETEGFSTDTRPLADEGGERLSLHARKSMRLIVDDLTALSKRFTSLARELDGRYDGWMVRHGDTQAR